ncbi:hypothetical protein V1517DRAFT_266462, partial [Lipomyces orientalis]
VYNPSAITNCRYCPISNGDQFLAASEIFWSQRWRNFGIGWAYIVFNIFGAVMRYYLIRVRKPTGDTKRTVSIMLHSLGKAGYWVRSLLTT